MVQLSFGEALDALQKSGICSDDVIWFQVVTRGFTVSALDDIVHVFTGGDVASVQELVNY